MRRAAKAKEAAERVDTLTSTVHFRRDVYELLGWVAQARKHREGGGRASVSRVINDLALRHWDELEAELPHGFGVQKRPASRA